MLVQCRALGNDGDPVIQLVPGRPSRSGLQWWINSDESMPAPHFVPQLPSGASARLVPVGTPSDGHLTQMIAVTGLPEGTWFELVVGPKRSRSRTLPSQINPGEEFVVALGSCFYEPNGPGAAGFYAPRVPGASADVHLRFLCGDQVYMDLPPTLVRPKPETKYLKAWQMADKFLSGSPTLMQADDHEFWNDYPHSQGHIRWTPDTETPYWRELHEQYRVFQLPLNVAPEAIAAAKGPADLLSCTTSTTDGFQLSVPPVSFFVLDTRSHRTRHDGQEAGFASVDGLAATVRWLHGLAGPGVLVLSEPILADAASYFDLFGLNIGVSDWHLPAYPHQYGTLMSALVAAKHDIIVLSGDIHWSRLMEFSAGGHSVYELISSPVSLIPTFVQSLLPPLQLLQRAPERPTMKIGDARRLTWLETGVGTMTVNGVARAVPPGLRGTFATARFRRVGAAPECEVLVDFWRKSDANPTLPQQAIPMTSVRMR